MRRLRRREPFRRHLPGDERHGDRDAGRTSQFTVAQPPVLSRCPDENEATATEPKMTKSFAACTLARSSGR
jgi:hypothetical protein